MMFDWKFWIVLISVVIGTIIGMFIIPQTKQNIEVIKEVEKSTVEVIFIDVADEGKLEEIVYSYFDEKQYKIIEKFYDELRNGWWVKLKKIKTKE